MVSSLTLLVLFEQVHEMDGSRVVHASRYPAPILSMALSPDASMLAVGMTDGVLSMRKAPKPARSGTQQLFPEFLPGFWSSGIK